MARRESITTTELAKDGAARDGERRHAESDSLPGVGATVAGKYRIDGLLGRGGMGVVALGRQLELDRAVAIKFLRAPLSSDARPLERFTREARIIARMRSEHVVRVFDVGRERGVPFIVMERLHGHDLSKEIDRGPVAVERAVEFVLHACEGLGEAHSLGIVHRDVKPSNLFVAQGLGGRESLKVLDFGVSKWLLPVDTEAPWISTGDAAIGTPAFASPEQLTRPETIDARTDVWALGVVLFQALSGTLPFHADTIPALYTAIIAGDPAPFPASPEVPAALVEVIVRCLRRDPAERYASMLELARALVPFAPARAHGIVDSLATLAAHPTVITPSEEAEPVASSLSTTLEFSHATARSDEPGARAGSPKRRGLVGALVALAAIGAVATVVEWPSPADRGEEQTPSITAADATPEQPPALTQAIAPPASATLLEPLPPVSVASPPASAAPSSAAPVATTAARQRAVQRRAVASPLPVASAVPASSAAPLASAPTTPGSNVVPIYRH